MNRPSSAVVCLLAAAALATSGCQRALSFESLEDGETSSGFRAMAVYLNDSDAAMGARFVHEESGFTLDVLEIPSVPQALTCVTTFPTSDMGEPHTEEHLLLGKGNVGRRVATAEPMALAASSAFTMQWRTCYAFNTAAGADVFYDQFEMRLDALLHPDYTDEEIRREVRNFSVNANADGLLTLEEGGTVYNEMVSSMDQPGRRINRAAMRAVYGDDHPLALNSGGSPEALRVIQPSDIREFHAAHYHLANMGAVLSLPPQMALEDVLESMDAILGRVEPENPGRPVFSEEDLPAPRPAPEGDIQLVPYPQSNASQPGDVWLVWPAVRDLDAFERIFLGLFLENLGGDPSTNLYKRFIDSQTREIELGAQSVFAGLVEDQGYPVIVGFGDVPVDKMSVSDLDDVRSRVLDEVSRVASWEAGSAELGDFNAALLSRVVELRRSLANFVNSPPEFGARGVGGGWITHLYQLNAEGGFEKALTLGPVLEDVERTLERRENVWTDYLRRWQLTNTVPQVFAAVPSPDLVEAAQRDRRSRVADEVNRLMEAYGESDEEATLRRYSRAYSEATARIEETASRIAPPRFVDDPPMTLDDQLNYRVEEVAGGVPLVVSTFDSMTAATAGLALDAHAVPEDRLIYLSLLPQLMSRVGVIEDGVPISYEEMSDRMRQEILSLDAGFSTNAGTGRVELRVRGAGNNAAEAQRAAQWMDLVLFHPDWRMENLPRIRDVVDQTLGQFRRTMQGAEEDWVRGVANAWWRQSEPLYLASTSFLTRAHYAQRLRWMLREGSVEDRRAAAAVLEDLADLRTSRDGLTARLAAMEAGGNPILADAAADLRLNLAELPDASLSEDWAHLCREIAGDLRVQPEAVLSRLGEVRDALLSRGSARFFEIASTANQTALASEVEDLATRLSDETTADAGYDSARRIEDRLLKRENSGGRPVFVGLVNPNSQSGVFLNSAPLTAYGDTDPDDLLDYLSAFLYGGGGAHSMFMKTWGAGLAYSNGIGANAALGRVSYYAERTPELPQTLRFVIGQLQAAEPDPSLVEYAVAQAFQGTRSASQFEDRGEQMANDLADGLTPEVVERFRRAILDLRDMPDLGSELFRRMPETYARVLPGMGAPVSGIEDGVYFVIGPETQLAAWQAYLQSVEGPGTIVHRLYPRDFWMD